MAYNRNNDYHYGQNSPSGVFPEGSRADQGQKHAQNMDMLNKASKNLWDTIGSNNTASGSSDATWVSRDKMSLRDMVQTTALITALISGGCGAYDSWVEKRYNPISVGYDAIKRTYQFADDVVTDKKRPQDTSTGAKIAAYTVITPFAAVIGVGNAAGNVAGSALMGALIGVVHAVRYFNEYNANSLQMTKPKT